MSALSIQPTFPIFTETDGLPLENGYIWIGAANLDPQGNPINVYWDAALTIAAPQPIRTLNGYPSRNGTPARLYVNSDYSIRVMNRNGSTVYSAPQATERYGNLINSEDITYDPPFAGALPTNVEYKLAQTVSVKDFGAVGDGVTDDTAAIQAALDASLCVEIPEGDYVVSNLTMRNGQTLRGCARSSVLSVKAGTTGSVVGVIGTNMTTGRLDDVKLQDFSIVGSSSAADGVRFENVFRSSAINLFITGCANGIRMERVELVDLTECQMLSNSAYGVQATRDSDAFLNSWVSFTNCIINGNTLGGVLLQDTASPVFVNTKIINNRDFGIQAQVKASKIGTVRCTYFQMSACDIDSNWNASVRLYNQANFSLANNWISGGRTSTQNSLNPAGQGIYVEDSSYGTLEGNIIYACGGNGIEINGAASAYNSIIGGWVGGNGNFAGIYIDAGSNHNVTGVTVQASGGSGFTQFYGIYFSNTADPLSNAHLVIANMVVDHVGANYTLVGAQTKCSLNNYDQVEKFNTGDSYEFKVDNVDCAWLGANAYRPGADNTSFLGLSTHRWKEVRAVDYYAGANVKGVSGSFTTADSKTVTVTNGIITNIV
jgi:parallel beta-helix repeat protein